LKFGKVLTASCLAFLGRTTLLEHLFVSTSGNRILDRGRRTSSVPGETALKQSAQSTNVEVEVGEDVRCAGATWRLSFR
jgi:hypothetical protein